MSGRRTKTAPNRGATRRPGSVTVPASTPSPSLAATEVDPTTTDLAPLLAAALCRGIADVRTGLDAELELTSVFGPMSVLTTGVGDLDELDEELLARLREEGRAGSGTASVEDGLTDLADGEEGDGEAAEVPDELETALAVAEALERRGDVPALAALRVLAALGLPEVHDVAGAAADRLASLGVAERPWAATVGRPRALNAWQWHSPSTDQEALGVLYADRGREHALFLLVDHSLGGGIRDAGLHVGRRARDLRALMQATLPRDEGQELLATPVEDVPGRLADLLRHGVCPGDEEQLRDVTSLLMLLRARATVVSR